LKHPEFDLNDPHVARVWEFGPGREPTVIGLHDAPWKARVEERRYWHWRSRRRRFWADVRARQQEKWREEGGRRDEEFAQRVRERHSRARAALRYSGAARIDGIVYRRGEFRSLSRPSRRPSRRAVVRRVRVSRSGSRRGPPALADDPEPEADLEGILVVLSARMLAHIRRHEARRWRLA
jgi:hypothetical protein